LITNKAIAQKLRDIRKSKGLSQKAMGALLGVTRDVIKDSELGRQKVSAVLYLNALNLMRKRGTPTQ
jgi:transcriptional regulator with XRE-family HTH domain